MIPGVVAGFPRSGGIVLVAQYTSSLYGGYVPTEGLGSISPAGASAIPGASQSVGSAGEILALNYELYEGVSRHLYIRVRGSYTSAPFSSVSVDGESGITGWQKASVDSSSTLFRVTGLSSNPIPAGSHKLVFA